jgi:hypothetical protein
VYVLKPTLTESGKAILLWLQKQSPLLVVLDNTRENVQIVRLEYLIYKKNGSVTESYIFSLSTTLLFWTMSSKSLSIMGCGDTPPAVAIPSVATTTASLSSRLGPLIAQY